MREREREMGKGGEGAAGEGGRERKAKEQSAKKEAHARARERESKERGKTEEGTNLNKDRRLPRLGIIVSSASLAIVFSSASLAAYNALRTGGDVDTLAGLSHIRLRRVVCVLKNKILGFRALVRG